MKIIVRVEEMPLMKGHYIVRWDSLVEPSDDFEGLSAEQVQEEFRIGFNEQMNNDKVEATRLW